MRRMRKVSQHKLYQGGYPTIRSSQTALRRRHSIASPALSFSERKMERKIRTEEGALQYEKFGIGEEIPQDNIITKVAKYARLLKPKVSDM